MIRFGTIEILAFVTGDSSYSPPLQPVYLPLEPGLTTLYGLNGAGKSLVLSGIEQVLTGESIPRLKWLFPALYVKGADAATEISEDSMDLHVHGTAAGLYDRFSPPAYPLGDIFESTVTWNDDNPFRAIGLIWRMRWHLESQFESFGGFPNDIDIATVIVEVLQQRRFLMRAKEGRDGRGWVVQPALERDHNLSEVVPVLDLLDTGVWKPSEVGELAVQRVARSLKSLIDPTKSWPALYRLLTWDDWATSNFQISVMGRENFSPDAVTRKALDSTSNFLWFSYFDADGTAATAVREPYQKWYTTLLSAARGEISGVPALESTEWLLTEAGEFDNTCGMGWFGRFLSWRANHYFARFLPEAPTLEFRMYSPAEWFGGERPAWGAIRNASVATSVDAASGHLIDESADSWVPLDSLSSAERRWARIAIELAIERRDGGFLLIDEPEAALHRSAERRMARALAEIAAERDLCVVVATHSPEVLDTPTAHVYLVRRSDQGLIDGHQVHPLEGESKKELQEFGLLPSDLLRRQKGFLLVEGQHDLIVLDTLIGSELERLRVELLPVRGAGRLASALDSRVLYDFTDAHMFVLLDALRYQDITKIWNDSLRMAKTGILSTAIAHADSELKALKIDEADALAAFATRALERGLAERHTPLALAASDILDYLPVKAFVPAADTWEALRLELTKSAGSPKSGSKFKKWLVDAKKADLTPEHIRQVCETLDHIPEDFTRILQEVERKLLEH